MITIYTLPHCIDCERTKVLMRRKNIKFNEVDLSQDNAARVRVRDDYGFSSAPVVETPDDVWSGFRPDLINEIGQ